MAKKTQRIKYTSKIYPMVDTKKLAKALGAELVTGVEERKRFEKKYGFPHPLLPITKKVDRVLTIACNKHLRYMAMRKPKTKCVTCHLIYILRWYHSKEGPDRLGGLNPYQFIVSGYQQLEDTLMGLKISYK